MPRTKLTEHKRADSISEAYKACVEMTRVASTSFHMALQTLPKPELLSTCAIYAFCRLCDDAVDGHSDQTSSADILDQLHSNLTMTYKSNSLPTGPVWLALMDTHQKFGVKFHDLEAVITGCRMDISKNRYETFSELVDYCSNVASAVGFACIEIFGYSDDRAAEFAKNLGLGMQLTNIIRDVSEDADANRIYIPQEDLRRFDYSEEDLLNKVESDNLRLLLKFQVERAREYLTKGRLLLPLLSKRSRLCPEAMIEGYAGILDSVESANYDVFSRRSSIGIRRKAILGARFFVKKHLLFLSHALL